MTLGPFLFMQPLALLGFLALPALWFLLRATPPEPKAVVLPSLPLFAELQAEEETPSKTPWWLIALRVLALVLAILGFAKPSWAPEQMVDVSARTLIIVDDGWTSADRWRQVRRNAIGAVDEASEGGAPVHLLFTAPQEFPFDPSEPMDPETARQVLRGADPSPWLADRADAQARLTAADFDPGRIVWLSDGLDHGSASSFASYLAGLATTEVVVNRPEGGFAITSADASSEGARVSVVRAMGVSDIEANVIAETREGASIASSRVEFATDEVAKDAVFEIPGAALNRIARFRIAGSESAGAVWLWDDAARRPHVGLADAGNESQPLLSEHYYVRKALQPYATLTERPLADLLEMQVSAIILGDRSALSDAEVSSLTDWMEGGGVLVRFAGPALASQSDLLVPTPLRAASRALDGSLAWDTPQELAPFANGSPFTGIPVPQDTVVRQQVLAQPSANLPSKTWATLEDGTPLVTADARGEGALVLFHVTADPDWSDLPYTGAFVEMLRRSVVSGGSRAQVQNDVTGTYSPTRSLDGYGVLTTPPAGATTIDGEAFDEVRAGPKTPPGFYEGIAGERALNAGDPVSPTFTAWPDNVQVKEDQQAPARRGVAGWLLSIAMMIVAVDLLIALAFSGKLPRFGRSAHAGLVLGFAVVAAGMGEHAEAQTDDAVTAAALDVTLAYVKTGDRRLDSITEAGLFGLSFQLGQRTSVEPEHPQGVNLETDALSVYPMIYFSVPRDAEPLSELAAANLNAYLRSGGAFVVDTRDAAPGQDVSGNLERVLAAIDTPPLQPVPSSHVLTRSYYLMKSFPGRLNGRLWVESGTADRDTRRGDGVSGIFIGGSDWAGAWAIDMQTGEPLLSMTGGPRAREMSYRFGINLVMHILTGNYKEDQVHVRDLLKRLGEDDSSSRGD